MGIRYDNRHIIDNNAEVYEDLRKSRDVKTVKQYSTPSIPPLTAVKRFGLTRVRHVWKTGDKYWNLADTHYGDPTLWWLIAWYNQRPTEAHIKMGDIIIIPKPVEKMLSLYYKG